MLSARGEYICARLASLASALNTGVRWQLKRIRSFKIYCRTASPGSVKSTKR